MQAMKVGDKAFFYHSNCKQPGIAGIVEVSHVFFVTFTVWRETLAVGKFGEFTAKSYWRNKIWRICYVAS